MVRDPASKFLCDHFDQNDSISATYSAVESLISGIKRCIPIDPVDYFSRRRIKKISFKKIKPRAQIRVRRDGFEIELRKDADGDDAPMQMQFNYFKNTLQREKISRFKFMIAHEIAHTFFFDSSKWPAQHWSNISKYYSMIDFSIRKEPLGMPIEEHLCQLGANLLTVPESLVASITKEGTSMPYFDELIRASNECGVTEEQILYRIANYLERRNDAGYIVSLIRKSSGNSPDGNWRFVRTKRSKGGRSRKATLPVPQDMRSRVKRNVLLPYETLLESASGSVDLIDCIKGDEKVRINAVGKKLRYKGYNGYFNVEVNGLSVDNKSNIGVICMKILK